MLRLRWCVLNHLLSSPYLATSPASHLHRLISATAPVAAPNAAFAVEDYLVETCGLTRAQALKASSSPPPTLMPSSPSSPASASPAPMPPWPSRRTPRLLCAKVDKALASNAAGLAGLGLSRCEIARIVSLAGYSFGNKSAVYKLQYYLPLLGSLEKLLHAMKFNCNLLTYSLERVTKPNVAFLRECGLGACDIAKLCVARPWMLTLNIDRL
ncbi:hypothetical protein VPH35_017578 [Triticum aestivum]